MHPRITNKALVQNNSKWTRPTKWAVIIVQCIEFIFFSFTFLFRYETSNGLRANEKGTLKTGTDPETGKPRDFIAATGAYSYTAPDGQVITVEYIADEFGFQPRGAHLPVAPPPQ